MDTVDEKMQDTHSQSPVSIAGSAKDEQTPLKTTHDGIILVPQPTDFPEDPLNWPSWKKHAALVVLALDALLLKASSTMIAPGAHKLAAQFGTAASTASYIGSAPAVMAGLGPFFWIPVSNKFGRRPVLLTGNLIALFFALAVARSESYAQALAFRYVMGFGASAGLCIGSAAVSDMFFLHERGKRMGFWTLLLVAAPYIGGVAGGSIQQNSSLGWRWSMYIAAILYSGIFLGQVFFVPETIYDRKSAVADTEEQKKSLSRRLLFRYPNSKDSWGDLFSRPLVMFSYPAVVLPSFWFSVAGMTEVCNTAGLSLNFGKGTRWDFNTQQVGFCFFAGLIGAILGELLAGPICDLVAKNHLKTGKEWKPEYLLKVSTTGTVTISAGLLLYGLELEYGSSWAAALTGQGIFMVGQEILVTVLLTYMCDCYPGRASELAVVFQFFVNMMAFGPPFFVPQWIAKPAGAKVPYIVFAALPLALWPLGVGLFMWRGPEIRAKGKFVNWFK